jgi:DNA-binding ferritin-like protein (Dps family)
MATEPTEPPTEQPTEPKRRYRQYLEMVTGSFEDKRRYRQYKARTERLPADYRATIEALQRYMQVFGPSDKADSLLAMLEDLADLFEQSAADATPIRDVVGDDPAEFVEAFLANYPGGQWINRERQRLRDAIDRATGDPS